MTNGIINALAHFGVRVGLVRFGVELFCKSGSDGYNKLRADKIVDRNKTNDNIPNGLCMHRGSIRYAIQINPIRCETFHHNGSNWYYNPLWTKSRYEMKLSANTPGGLLVHPSSFRQAFQIVRASAILSSSTVSVWYYELHSYKF